MHISTVAFAHSRYTDPPSSADTPEDSAAKVFGGNQTLSGDMWSTAFVGLPPALAWCADPKIKGILTHWFAEMARRRGGCPTLTGFGTQLAARALTIGVLSGTIEIGMRAVADQFNVAVIGSSLASSEGARNKAALCPTAALYFRSSIMSQALVQKAIENLLGKSRFAAFNTATQAAVAFGGTMLGAHVLLRNDGLEKSLLVGPAGHADNNRDLKNDLGHYDPKRIVTALLVKSLQAATNAGLQESMRAQTAISQADRMTWRGFHESAAIFSVFLSLRLAVSIGAQNTKMKLLDRDVDSRQTTADPQEPSD